MIEHQGGRADANDSTFHARLEKRSPVGFGSTSPFFVLRSPLELGV